MKESRQSASVHPMHPTSFEVRRVTSETRDTFTFELSPKNGGIRFAPGQFNMLYLFGVGEVPISISGDPEKPDSLMHTVRAVGNVTKVMRMHRRGDTIGVRGPFGTGWPVAETRGHDVLIVAGGIGLAPLRPAIYSLLSHREQYGKIAILYGTRTPEDILFRREVERWRSRFDLEVRITVDRALAGWHGSVGVVPSLIARVSLDMQNTFAMVCGPEIMMRFTAGELQKRGVPQERIYVSMERNMKCGVGLCGHCQYGPKFICRDGPVFPFNAISNLFYLREL